jgi:4-hydroxybenzoate polyprenyltransferase
MDRYEHQGMSSDPRGLSQPRAGRFSVSQAPMTIAPPAASERQRLRAADLAALVRVTQWPKNIFVLAPALFGGALLTAHGIMSAVLATACFCLLSSAVYVLNDLVDVGADRQHPRKSRRPIASGRVSALAAVAVLTLLVGLAGATSALCLPVPFLLLAGLYLFNSTVYCLWLKHRVLVDVMLIAIGFVIRLLAGCAAVDVQPSSWLAVCGFSLALVLGFGKRRAELEILGANSPYRPSLLCYDRAKLDTLLGIGTAVCLLSYMLYTIAPDTVARHGTGNLIYTVPFVAYGLFRYLFKAQEGKGDGPSEILGRDPVFLLTGLLWGCAALAILYWR